MHIKKSTPHIYKSIFFVILISIAIIGVLYLSNSTEDQVSINSQAKNDSNLTVMAYNVQFDTNDSEMEALAQYLKKNNIEIVALTELTEVKDDDCSECEQDDRDALLNELERIGYSMESEFIRVTKQSQGSRETNYYRGILSRFPIISYAHSDILHSIWGYQTILINHPKLGQIRFIDTHPAPQNSCSGQYCPAVSIDLLLNYAATFSEPKILLGDFNLFWADLNHHPYLEHITKEYAEGCDVNRNSTCNDSVTDNRVWAMDHIFIEKNRGLHTIEGYIDHSYTVSDHMPVIVTISNETSLASTPTPKTLPETVDKITTSTISATPTSTISTPPNTISTIEPTSSSCPQRVKGDANCDNIVDYLDFICWRAEINNSPLRNCVSANFIGEDSTVDAQDYAIWFTNFKKNSNI